MKELLKVENYPMYAEKSTLYGHHAKGRAGLDLAIRAVADDHVLRIEPRLVTHGSTMTCPIDIHAALPLRVDPPRRVPPAFRR